MTTKPITMKLGRLTAKIWENQGPNGSFYNVTVTRTYRDKQGKYHESTSFTQSDLLFAARLTHKAYDRIAELAGENETTSEGSSS